MLADGVQPANSNQSTEPGALQVRPPAKAAADQAPLPPAPKEEELVLAHKLKTYEVGFLWDGDQLAAEVNSDQGERVHVHRPGTFFPLLQVEQGEVFHVITDHLGTPKELIDGESRVAWSAAHGAWNNIQEQWFDDAHPRGRRVSSPFRGLGQYYDAETQLSCTRYRYWEADTGRWLSGDPLGIYGGPNLFGFCGLPTLNADPLGLACEEVVYVHKDKEGNIVYIGITNDPKRRAAEHRADASKTGETMHVVTGKLSHDDARTIEARMIRDRLQRAEDAGTITGREDVAVQLQNAGLQNKNRGRDPDNHSTGWTDAEPSSYDDPATVGEPHDIKTPPSTG